MVLYTLVWWLASKFYEPIATKYIIQLLPGTLHLT